MPDIFDFQPHFLGDRKNPRSFEPSLREIIRYYYKQIPDETRSCTNFYIEQVIKQIEKEKKLFALDAIHDSSIQKELFNDKELQNE